MVKPAHPTRVACLVTLVGLPLWAGETFTYHVGDVAGADVTTPVALDVIDPVATAALQADRAAQVPSVFRYFPDATNAMARDFLAAFARARTGFTAAVAGEFNSPQVDGATVLSENFGYLVTAYNVRHKDFPVTTELAAEWARGNDGGEIRDRILGLLEAQTGQPLRPDSLPDGFEIGETLRLVPVTKANQKLTLADVSAGKLAKTTSLTTVARAQSLFRREFSAVDQPFARAMAEFIKPSCLPDAPLTQLARAEAVRQIVVAEHFDAGQTVVHWGDTIDEKTKVALDALNGKLTPGLLNAPVSGARGGVPPEEPAAQLARDPASPSSIVPQDAQAGGAQLRNPSQVTPEPAWKVYARDAWPLAVVAVMILSVPILLWRYMTRRGKKNARPTAAVPVTTPAPGTTPAVAVAPAVVASAVMTPTIATLHAELAPQVAQAVREAVMQELALQRRELMLAQQVATDEIVALVHRLDQLQLPMQERLRAYEGQIQRLERELAARNEENRELLKLKIDMMRRQLERERAHTWKEWTDFNN
jgi:hypothetical protein